MKIGSVLLKVILALVVIIGINSCNKPSSSTVAQSNVDYWTCTMHPSVHSKTPGKCPICGMDLVPVTLRKVETSRPDEFIVPVQRQQQFGVTYSLVQRREMQFDLRSVGTLEVDQARIFECDA